MNMAPFLISLDIETYGLCESLNGRPLPEQTVFHPYHSIVTDLASTDAPLILTCSVTTPTSQPAAISGYGDLAHLEPGETRIFEFHKPGHISMLAAWLRRATHIVGHNLLFDLLYLRCIPRHRLPLNGRQTLLDTTVLNFLHCELRPEKSLKNLGPVLGAYAYTENTLRTGHRFASLNEEALRYNAEDTHNNLLLVSALARLILRDFPNSPKLSSFTMNHFSDTLWALIRMSESGTPFSRPSITRLENLYRTKAEKAASIAATYFDFPLFGKGSGKAREALIESTVEDLENQGHPLRTEGLLELTEKQGKISTKDANRELITKKLPPNHKAAPLFRLWDISATNQKLLSSYTYPLLRHKRNNTSDRRSRLIPHPMCRPETPVHFAFPNWFLVRSTDKQGTAEGGTIQGRITCVNPGLQTLPRPFRKQITSRFRDGSIVDFDLSQIELRVAALVSGDTSLIHAYTNGHDLHSRRAATIWTPEELNERYPGIIDHAPEDWKHLYPNFDDRERQVGKRVNFADLFRSGALKMQSATAGDIGEVLPLSLFSSIVDARPTVRPGLYNFQNELISLAHRNGHIILPVTGHSRTFKGGTKYDVSEIVNFPIQTIAGIVMLRLKIYLHKYVLPALIRHLYGDIHMLVNIYDAIYFDARTRAIPTLRSAMNDALTWLQEEDYWHLLQTHYNRRVPLSF